MSLKPLPWQVNHFIIKYGGDSLIWDCLIEVLWLKFVNDLFGTGANPGIVNNNDQTALQWAREKGHTEIVDFLISAGRAVSNLEKTLGF